MNKMFNEAVKQAVVPNFDSIKLWKDILKTCKKLPTNEKNFYIHYAKNV